MRKLASLLESAPCSCERGRRKSVTWLEDELIGMRFRVLETPACATRVDGQSSNQSSSITIIWVSGPYSEMAMDLPGPSSSCTVGLAQPGVFLQVTQEVLQKQHRMCLGDKWKSLSAATEKKDDVEEEEDEESDKKTRQSTTIKGPSSDEKQIPGPWRPVMLRRLFQIGSDLPNGSARKALFGEEKDESTKSVKIMKHDD
ncbi:hypothetical protein Tco_0064465 [Tanacetum coccineum]